MTDQKSSDVSEIAWVLNKHRVSNKHQGSNKCRGFAARVYGSQVYYTLQ